MIKYQHFALDNLYLTNGYREMQTNYGIEREYDREEELEQCVRRLLLRKPEPLRGWDLRFLRRGLELSQADFGKMVDRDAQTVARWEKSAELVPKFVDLMIRARFAERFEPKIELAEVLNFIDGTAPALPKQIQLFLSTDGWKFTFELLTTLPITTAWIINSAALPAGYGGLYQMISKKIDFTSGDLSVHDYPSSDAPDPLTLGFNLTGMITASGNMPVFLPDQLQPRTIQ